MKGLKFEIVSIIFTIFRGVTFEEIHTNKNNIVKMCTDTFVTENGALSRSLRTSCFKIAEHLSIVHPSHTM